MSDAQAGILNYTRTDAVVMPQSAAEMRFALRKSDWERLKRNLGRCKEEVPSDLSGWYFCLFGVCGSAAASIISLAYAKGLPEWVVPAYYAVTIGSGILGFVLWKLDQKLCREKKDRLDELSLDMKDIENGFTSMT
jgi:hypothetical protein